jgi:hypothetical protein
MAFGFLKKIVDILTGGGKKKRGKGNQSKNGRGKNNRNNGRGREQSARAQEQKSGRGGKNQPQQRQQQKGAQQQRGGGQNGGGAKSSQQRGERRDRRERDRSRNGSRRSPATVNTKAGEMRPGGEIPAAELAARKAAHEAWSIDQFAVEPLEGKKRFHDFDLPSEVMHGIADLGFKYATDIQALSLEQALAGKNIAGKAQTGSGKTAAFLVAILTRYLRTPENRAKEGGNPRALVIAPTRELVIQICKDADAIGKYCNLRSLAVYGGMDYDRQRKEVLGAPVDLLHLRTSRIWGSITP